MAKDECAELCLRTRRRRQQKSAVAMLPNYFCLLRLKVEVTEYEIRTFRINTGTR
jgi:hypothetical protein